jgi:electron transfer flavoprotein beta subunit
LNECDDYAVDEAVRLKKLLGGRVRAVTVGPLRASEILYQAVAKGADDSLRVDCDMDDPTVVAHLIAAVCSQGNFDLIVTGVESNDELASTVGPSVAALLNRPFATSVTRIEPAEGIRGLVVDKELGGGRVQRLMLPLPAVVSVQSGICRLTYAATAKVLQARRMPPRSLSPASLGVPVPAPPRMLDITTPKREREPEMLTGQPQQVAEALMVRIAQALRG